MLTSAMTIDLVLLGILAIFTVQGAYRGLLLSLLGLFAIGVALVGGALSANLLAPRVADYLEPRFAAAIEEKLESEMKSSLPSVGETDPDNISLSRMLDILKDMGLYQSAVSAIDKAIQSGMTDVAAGTAAAVAASLAGNVAYMLIFILAFALILLLWTVLSRALDLVANLPGLHFLNKTGGAVFGLLKGCAFLFLFAWVLRYLGALLPEETVEKTRVLRFFLTENPFLLLQTAGKAVSSFA